MIQWGLYFEVDLESSFNSPVKQVHSAWLASAGSELRMIMLFHPNTLDHFAKASRYWPSCMLSRLASKCASKNSCKFLSFAACPPWSACLHPLAHSGFQETKATDGTGNLEIRA
jgi:hypothetical protein